ncbi:hypothetical protein [Capsulimonas corticalis]|nr:hypothetical protein [Capsulimonas corticalis]
MQTTATPPVARETHLSPDRSEPTRYLCASAYLNPVFRSQFLAHLSSPYHTLGRAYGLDLHRIAQHCLKAERRLIDKELVLFGLFVMCGLNFAHNPQILTASCLIAAIVLQVNDYVVRYKIAAGKFSRNTFAPSEPLEPLPPRINDAVQHAEQEQVGNLVVYGGFLPFVGFGSSVKAWSFGVNIKDGKKTLGSMLKPKEFDLTQLQQKVSSSLALLGIAGVYEEEVAFVSGTAIRSKPSLLPNICGRPATVIPEEEVAGAEGEDDQLRRYRCLRVPAWSGEVAVALLYRFRVMGDNLYVEANWRGLLPIAKQYQNVDNIPNKPRLMVLFSRFVLNVIIAPFYMALSPFIILIRIINAYEGYRRRATLKASILDNPLFNYGADISLRERFSSDEYEKYFQYLDKEMYVKIIDREFLDEIVNFLDEHNIDTSIIRERAEAILNHGVIVSGGNINAKNVAAGQGAIAGVMKAVGSHAKG